MFRTPATKNKVDQSVLVNEKRAGLSPIASTNENTDTSPITNFPKTPIRQAPPPKIKPPIKTNTIIKKTATAETPSPILSPRTAREFFPNRAAEARAVYRKGVLNLEKFKNLRASVKFEIRKALDRLYALANDGPAVRNLELQMNEDIPPATINEIKETERVKQPSNLEKILEEHTQLMKESMKGMEELKISIQKTEHIKNIIEQQTDIFTKATYSSVVTANTATEKDKERASLHSVIITSKDEQETGEEVLEKVRRAIDAKEGWIKVEKVRKAKDRKIVVGCATEDERKKIKERLENAKQNLVVEEVKNRDPLLVLKDVISKHTDEEVLKALKNQNQEIFQDLDSESCRMAVKYRKKARNPHTNHIVLTVSPLIWRRAVDTGRLRVDLQRVYVEDQSPLVQCSRCLGYGHSRRFCGETEDLCSHCGGPHLGTECPDRVVEEAPECINCKRAKFENRKHNAFSKECPVRKKWDTIARASVSYC